MENPAQFDLNERICVWRERLLNAAALKHGDVAELEAHLRDGCADLRTRGLSEEEAFLVAARRLGHGDQLDREFSKVNAGRVWLTRGLWMLAGIQLSSLLFDLVHGAGDITVLTLPALLPVGKTGLVVVGLGVKLATLVGLAALCWWLIGRKGPEPARILRSFFRRPIVAAATLVLLSLAGLAWRCSATLLFARAYSPKDLGTYMAANSYASLILVAIHVFVLPVGLVWFAKQRLAETSAPVDPGSS